MWFQSILLTVRDSSFKINNMIKKISYCWTRSKKNQRDARWREWLDYWHGRLDDEVGAVEVESDGFEIILPELGTCTFFPKSNMLLVRKDNSWYPQGLLRIVKYLGINVAI